MKNKRIVQHDASIQPRIVESPKSENNPNSAILQVAQNEPFLDQPDLASIDGLLVDEAFQSADEPQENFVDIVDPDTGEVTPLEFPDEAPSMYSVPEASEEDQVDDSVSQKDDQELEEERVVAAIVAYLLSPEGGELRHQVREAAYQARKAAYEAAFYEISPLIEACQARLLELDEALQHIPEKALDDLGSIGLEEACQAARQTAQVSQRNLQSIEERLKRMKELVEESRLLVQAGKLPGLVLEGLEAECQVADLVYAEAMAAFEFDQNALQKAMAEWEQAQRIVEDSQQEEKQRLEREKEQPEVEIQQLQIRLKERQEEIAGTVPEVTLWRSVQVERGRREGEAVERLVRLLPSQGIRKILSEAARLGVSANPLLLQAIAERQAWVSSRIEACRAQAERLAAYSEVLPKGAFALLVRGDTIRIIDPEGRELETHVAGEEEGEFRKLSGQSGRRWKIVPGQDCFLVQQ